MEFFSAFGHNESQAHYHSIYNTEEILPHHKASFTHEAIAGAAGFAAMHAYESHLRATGHQPSHSLMKEILAGIAAAEVDKLVETKGLNWIDHHKAKKMAIHQAHELAHHRYQGGGGWEYAQAQAGPSIAYNYEGGLPWGVGGGYPPPQAGYYPPPQGYPQPWYGAPTQVFYGVQPGYGEGYNEHHEHHHGHHHGHHRD